MFYIEKSNYEPVVKEANGNYRFYIKYIDGLRQTQIIEVTEDLFLEFFGTHRVSINESGQKNYCIVHKDKNFPIYREVDYKTYKSFFSFKSMDRRYQNFVNNYIEQSELTEYSLHQRLLEEPPTTLDELYTNEVYQALYEAIESLDTLQRSRLVRYYFDSMTYSQIATMDGCSIASIKSSIDIAKGKIKVKIKKFKF